jgi:hypothetical protein
MNMKTYEDILLRMTEIDPETLTEALLTELFLDIDAFNEKHPRETTKKIVLQEQLQILQTMYESQREIERASSTYTSLSSSLARTSHSYGGAGAASDYHPTRVVESHRTQFADYFDELKSVSERYLSLSKKTTSRDEDFVELSALLIDAQKVIPSEEKKAGIEDLQAKLPHLNNLAFMTKIETKLVESPGKRQVRGDGNCYYRSIMYAYLEQVMCLPDGFKEEMIDRLNDKLRALIGKFGLDYDRDLNALITILTRTRNGESLTSVKELEAEMKRPGSNLDFLLVRAARALTADELMRDEVAPNMFVEDEFDQYVRDTLSMKIDADSPAVELNCLGRALGVNTILQNIDSSGNIQRVDTLGIEGSIPKIHLLRDNTGTGRGDAHYFILYDREQDAELRKHLSPVESSEAASSRTFSRK